MCLPPFAPHGLDLGQYSCFTRPAQPLANQDFQLFFLTGHALAQPTIWFNDLCYGGALLTRCKEVGAGCAGWNVLWADLNESAGTYQIRLMVNDPDAPCIDDLGNSPPVVAECTVTVLP